MNSTIVACAALLASGVAMAQGLMTSPSTGAGAAGGSPVGMVLPSTVQSGSTAPTQPGRTIAPSAPQSASSTYHSLDRTGRGYLTRDDVRDLRGFSFDAADTNQDGRITSEEFARASIGDAVR